MTTDRRPRRWDVLPVGAAVLVMAATSTVAIAASSGAFADHRGSNASSQSCAVPALAGSPVSVALVDMRAMMSDTVTSGGMMGGGGPLISQHNWTRFRHGMMHVTVAPKSVSSGTASLRVHNTGYLTHELVVLPLASGQAAGSRVPGSDGRVAEDGSLGEASASCASGTGRGITAGSTGWVTLNLPAGRYEILCNLPGHYAAGMYTELLAT
ncbi:MAG: hypothetical protein M3Y44_03955 [Actinomycetota bacterium]|nr:hypothetical protein [Actinomycetota bacterium]